MWKFLLVFAVCLCRLVECHRILMVFPLPVQSHVILGNGFLRPLLADGHQVTYITPSLVKNPPSNLHQVDVSENYKFFDKGTPNLTSLLSPDKSARRPSSFPGLFNVTLRTIENVEIQKLLRDPKQQFDLVVLDYIFSDLLIGFPAVFNCPYVWFSSLEPHWGTLRLIDESPNPSYHPGFMSSKAPPLGFVDRVKELLVPVFVDSYKYFYTTGNEHEEYVKLFGPAAAIRGHKLAPYEDVKYNASLIFGNSHVSIGSAIRLPQNYKPIGGFHVDRNLKPLPEDLKKIMEASENGVIYFSMGSILNSKDLPESVKISLVQMLGSLKQTVLWKFEEDFPNLPKNVHILKWAPQTSILAHPNCVLFITHGGLLSTTEAIFYGKPIVGIPVFADQFSNVDRAVQQGYAKKVDLSYDMADELKRAVEDVIGDSRYSERVRELSFIFHDRPMTPDLELVHWVRHVVATRGAFYMRSPALMMPWWQKLYLDFAAVVLATLTALFWILKRLCCKAKVPVSAKVNRTKKSK